MYLAHYLLDCVLLCDSIREPSLLREVVGRSLMVSLKADLAKCFLQQMKNKRLPSASLLYDARINLDMACMLYAKQFWFSKSADEQNRWICHVRCDSSPQYGRDYLVTQLDYVVVGIDYTSTTISKRLMPLQCVGTRSGSAAHKLEKIKFCLGLESEDLSFTADRVFSILTDFGTESSLWFTPSVECEDVSEPLSVEDLLLFKNALPLPDGDHGLHHIMLVMTEFFSWDDEFKEQLASLSRYFSIRDRCDRFIVKCIFQNEQIESYRLKQSFATMYKATCPTLVATRWNFIYEVLHWLIPRQQSLAFLLNDIGSGSARDNFAEFIEKEMRIIQVVADPANETSALFWARCCLCFELANWGAVVSSFFHSCPISAHDWEPLQATCSKCCWKGRMGSKLAEGIWIDKFSKDLLNLSSDSANQWMKNINIEKRQELLQEFQACKVKMAQRVLQVFEFWRVLPWRLLALAPVLFCDPDMPQIVADAYVQASKVYCQEILRNWNEKEPHSQDRQFTHSITRKFLDPSFPHNLRADMEWWAATSSKQMPRALAFELMAYASGLTVMQQLEGQHHYLGMHQGGARASLPASVCAFLRRRFNPDLQDPRLRQNLEKYLRHIPKLVACEWEKRKDLIRHVYGFSLEMLHGDVTVSTQQLEHAKLALKNSHSSSDANAVGDREKTIQTEHLQKRIVHGKFYRVRTGGESAPKYIAFQCVCTQPTKRSYVQRVCHMGKDIWKDSIAILVCAAADNPHSLDNVYCQSHSLCFIMWSLRVTLLVVTRQDAFSLEFSQLSLLSAP